MLGILKAGGAYVPLDPQTPPQRLSLMAADAQMRFVLTRETLKERLWQTGARLIFLDHDADFLACQSQTNLPAVAGAENLAYVMYTSGSTGVPKGVEIVHRGITRLLYGVDYARLDASLRVGQLAPVSFDASTFEIWGPLLHGGSCVLFPERVPDPADLEQRIRRYRVNTLWLTASLFHSIVDERAQALAGIDQLLTGGEVLSPDHVRRALGALGPRTRLINGYGPTESTTFACCYRIPQEVPAGAVSVPIGRPIANTQAFVLDAKGKPVPIGVPGELCLGGDGLARGYLHRSELTAERFIEHPFCAERGARLYRTGDRVRWLADGNLEFLGRWDDQVKIRGFRIELGEIEAVLASHAAVRQCAVSVREDTPGDKRLAAYWVAQPGATATPSDLREHLRIRLPDYMVPAAFVRLEALPLNINGKVDQKSAAGARCCKRRGGEGVRGSAHACGGGPGGDLGRGSASRASRYPRRFLRAGRTLAVGDHAAGPHSRTSGSPGVTGHPVPGTDRGGIRQGTASA